MGRRGFTLLEMIVASTIMAVAIVGLLEGLSGSTHTAARLQDYDRAVELGRQRMNELILDAGLPHDTPLIGQFAPSQAGGLAAGWRARVTVFEYPPQIQLGQSVLDRLELEVWWKSGQTTRTYSLEAFRMRPAVQDDVVRAAAARVAP